MTSIALCVPTTPWVAARRASMARLRANIGVSVIKGTDDEVKGHAWDVPQGSGPQHYMELTDRAPNEVWSVTMWKWMLETGADFCLTLQDDALTAPPHVFWPALRAMLTHLPKGAALGLSAVHPIQREVARKNLRWFATQSWIIGWAYGLWREDLEEFLKWRTSEQGEEVQKKIHPNGEDALLNVWMGITQRFCWHPTPTIADHDTSVGSSYDNDHHGHRRPWVTWHEYPEAQLTRPDWWACNGKLPQHYHTVAQNICWWCGKNPPDRGSEATKATICAQCIMDNVASLLTERGVLLQKLSRGV